MGGSRKWQRREPGVIEWERIVYIAYMNLH